MKSLKAICAAAILALALSVPAYAGDIQTPGKASPVTGGISTPDVTPATADVPSNPDTESSMTVLADILWALASLY
jgi:hypothetical protein